MPLNRNRSRSDDPLLRILEDGGGVPISGEEACRALGMTRAAVWKRIEALRRKGYEVEGRRGVGYRIVSRPDTLDAEEIRALLPRRSMWRDIVVIPTVDSTNGKAAALAEDGALEGTVVVADVQERGRGRLGRIWVSPPGKNVAVSILLRPKVEPAVVSCLSLVAGIALAEAVESVCGLTALLKWPNDLYLDGRKIAGILAEMSSDADGIRHVVVGVGVNVNATTDDFPPELRKKAGSLLVASSSQVSRNRLLGAFLASFEEAYRLFLFRGFAPLRAAWENRSLLTGRRIRLSVRDGVAAGVVLGLADDGALRFRRDGASADETIIGGEIVDFTL